MACPDPLRQIRDDNGRKCSTIGSTAAAHRAERGRQGSQGLQRQLQGPHQRRGQPVDPPDVEPREILAKSLRRRGPAVDLADRPQTACAKIISFDRPSAERFYARFADLGACASQSRWRPNYHSNPIKSAAQLGQALHVCRVLLMTGPLPHADGDKLAGFFQAQL